jgi:hypothetical protein
LPWVVVSKPRRGRSEGSGVSGYLREVGAVWASRGKKMRIKTIAFATMSVLVAGAQAQVAYNSFLPGYGWDQTVGYGINGLGAPPKFIQSFAVGFEAAESGTVNQISVAVGFLGLGTGRNVLWTVSLFFHAKKAAINGNTKKLIFLG